MAKYKIWNKTENIITPIGEYLTPKQWIERYPAAAHIDYVIADSDVNGSFCSPLSQMIAVYEQTGVDFSQCKTSEEKLAAIEAFEIAQAEAAANAVSTEERTAAALEFIAVNSLPDEV